MSFLKEENVEVKHFESNSNELSEKEQIKNKLKEIRELKEQLRIRENDKIDPKNLIIDHYILSDFNSKSKAVHLKSLRTKGIRKFFSPNNKKRRKTKDVISNRNK